MFTYTIQRSVNYFGGTSARAQYKIVRNDGKVCAIYDKLAAAKADLPFFPSK